MRVLLALAILVAAALGVWLWLSVDGTKGAGALPPQSDAGVESPAGVTASGVLPERTPVTGAGAPADPGEGAVARLLVRVRRLEEDAPVAGVRVVLRGADASPGTAPLKLAGLTDADGECKLVHPGSLVVHSTRALPTTETSGEIRWLGGQWVGAGDELVLTVLVSGGSTLAGRVVDPFGTPVAGARVLAWCSERFDPDEPADREALADGSGRFEIEHLGTSFHLIAAGEGLACSQGLRGKLAPGIRAEGGLELGLLPAMSVRGRVVGSRGEPLQARLSTQEPNFGSSTDNTSVPGVSRFRPVLGSADCDPGGAFELGPLPLHPWRVFVEHPEHLPWAGSAPTDGSEWLIRLATGCGVTGSVLRADGLPLADARVGLVPGEGNWRFVRSAADGSFRVTGAACGEGAMLTVDAPGHAPWVRAGMELVDGSPLRIEARLEAGLPLAGRVVDQAGAGVPGAKLVIEGERTYSRDYSSDSPATWEHLLGRGEVHARPSGDFRFEDLYPGRFRIRVYPRGEAESHQDFVAVAGDEALELVLDGASEGVVFEGRVFDRRSGAPVRAFNVTPMVWEGNIANGRGREVVHDEGRFRLAGYAPARMELRVIAPGYATWSDSPREMAPGVQRYAVGLVRLRVVELRLVRPDGQPYEQSAAASFATAAGERVMIQYDTRSSSTARLHRGSVQGLRLPAELIQVSFDLHDGEPPLVFDLDLAQDPSEVFEFRVPRDASAPFSLHVLLLSVADDELAQALARAQDAQPLEIPKISAEDRLGVKLAWSARNARGGTVSRGTLEPEAEGYVWEQEHMDGGSLGGTLRLPLLDFELPAKAVELVLMADGHRPRTLALDPARANGGLPRVIALVRR